MGKSGLVSSFASSLTTLGCIASGKKKVLNLLNLVKSKGHFGSLVESYSIGLGSRDL